MLLYRAFSLVVVVKKRQSAVAVAEEIIFSWLQ